MKIIYQCEICGSTHDNVEFALTCEQICWTGSRHNLIQSYRGVNKELLAIANKLYEAVENKHRI